MRLAALALLVLTGGLTPPARLVAQEPPLIAPTNALSPADERKAFTVPAGFDVQLVASEPDIQKPIQIAFDAKGRLGHRRTTIHSRPRPGKPPTSSSSFPTSIRDGKAKKCRSSRTT